MIRGNVDNVTETSIAGWVYADTASVRDRMVLAFVGDQCVGAGRVEHFRQDLADAGLTDGVLGFDFPILLAAADDRPRVTVRLEGSDAVLLQPGSCVASRDDAGRAGSTVQHAPRSLSSLQWMRMRGWLHQSEYDFLKYIDQLGVYERTLRHPKWVGDVNEPVNLDPAAVALELLQLYHLDDVALETQRIDSVHDLPAFAQRRPANTGFQAVVALWSAERTRIGVVEGSHRQAGAPGTAAPGAAIDYHLGPDHLLVVDPRCTVMSRGVAPAGGIAVFTADAR
ncbi:MAG: hypothetical protein ACOYOH_09365 [Paracraurococcus sp.]